jgi:hypothetical protein
VWEVDESLSAPTGDGTSQPVLTRRVRAAMHHALQEILTANGHRVTNRMGDGILVTESTTTPNG